ncbi:MAG: outer membrane protein assembly factor BamD [Burkholderiaceae bacterium]
MRSMTPWMTWAHRLAVALAVLVLAACGAPEVRDPTLGWTAEKLYADAKEEMEAGRWGTAVKQLEKIESRYPFGRWAQQAQIDIAYVHYKENDRALALAATDRFLKLYPSHPALDYVYYLRGLINFNEQQGWLASLGGQDLSERDLQAAREAFDAFKEVVARFPESRYAPDAEARMKYLVNAMASGEVHIARYYFRRGAYVAAANRAQGAIRQYPQAPAIEEALYLLMASYDKLGLDELRGDTERVLRRNFPSSRYLSLEAAAERRWWQVWR